MKGLARKLKVAEPWVSWNEIGGSAKQWYVGATIMAGADSLSKLMGVTYLSQFGDLNGEFAERPVFKPDFLVGPIPYSRELLRIYNNFHHWVGGGFSDGSHLEVGVKANTDAEIKSLLENGAQLGRLYLANKDTLSRAIDTRDLFHAVNNCVERDKKVRENLDYLSRF